MAVACEASFWIGDDNNRAETRAAFVLRQITPPTFSGYDPMSGLSPLLGSSDSFRNSDSRFGSGVGFLIDYDHGLVLTAAHVVSVYRELIDCEEMDENVEYPVVFADLNGDLRRAENEELRLLAIRHCDDLAILQFNDLDTIKDFYLESFDVIFSSPSENSDFSLYVPLSEAPSGPLILRGLDSPILINTQSTGIDARCHRRPGKCLLVEGVAVDDGYSGAPVVDRTGRVVAVVVRRREGLNHGGAAVPTEFAWPMLSEVYKDLLPQEEIDKNVRILVEWMVSSENPQEDRRVMGMSAPLLSVVLPEAAKIVATERLGEEGCIDCLGLTLARSRKLHRTIESILYLENMRHIDLLEDPKPADAALLDVTRNLIAAANNLIKNDSSERALFLLETANVGFGRIISNYLQKENGNQLIAALTAQAPFGEAIPVPAAISPSATTTYRSVSWEISFSNHIDDEVSLKDSDLEKIAALFGLSPEKFDADVTPARDDQLSKILKEYADSLRITAGLKSSIEGAPGVYELEQLAVAASFWAVRLAQSGEVLYQAHETFGASLAAAGRLEDATTAYSRAFLTALTVRQPQSRDIQRLMARMRETSETPIDLLAARVEVKAIASMPIVPRLQETLPALEFYRTSIVPIGVR